MNNILFYYVVLRYIFANRMEATGYTESATMLQAHKKTSEQGQTM